jgi:hypothetical protein
MRKISYILWLLLGSIALSAQPSYFYYYDGKKQHLELDTKHLIRSVSEQDTANLFASDGEIQI